MAPPPQEQQAQGIDTLLVHAGLPKHRPEGAAIMPVFMSATFGHHGPEPRPADAYGCWYTRPADNPNHRVLAAKIAALEGTEDALVLGSGMAAISSTMLAILGPGDHFLTQAQLYGCTHSVFHSELARLGIELTAVDVSDPGSWAAALRPNTKAFYVEAISNPLLEVGELEAVAAFARQHSLASVIDSTFAPPVNFRPAAQLGFDLTIHSGTKYANGHSDVVAGIVAGSAARIAQVTERLMQYGGVLDPHAAFLLSRGLATLGLRVRQQNATGLAVARFLQAHPQVARVFYPGLKECRGHAVAARLFAGFGGVVSVELLGGTEAAETFVHALRIPLIAVSLGGVESLACVPAQSTHRIVPPEARKAAGISDGLVRLAFGIETTEDLVADVQQALAQVSAGARLPN